MDEQIALRLHERTAGSYLAALANGRPTPGGGSAAGLAGALGCALGEMVCQLTLAQTESQELVELCETLARLREGLLRLAERDENVFMAYRTAVALPRGTATAKADRRAAIESALVAAAEVPVEMTTLGLNAIETLRLVGATGTIHALGDLLTGGFLIQAMVLGSLENLETNAKLMKDKDHQAHFVAAASSVRTDLGSEMSAFEATIHGRRAQARH